MKKTEMPHSTKKQWGVAIGWAALMATCGGTDINHAFTGGKVEAHKAVFRTPGGEFGLNHSLQNVAIETADGCNTILSEMNLERGKNSLTITEEKVQMMNNIYNEAEKRLGVLEPGQRHSANEAEIIKNLFAENGLETAESPTNMLLLRERIKKLEQSAKWGKEQIEEMEKLKADGLKAFLDGQRATTLDLLEKFGCTGGEVVMTCLPSKNPEEISLIFHALVRDKMGWIFNPDCNNPETH